MKYLAATLLVLATIQFAQATAPADCTGVRNEQPVLELSAQALKTVANGQSWKMEQGNNVLYLAKVSGTPFQMGYALGELYGAEIAKNLQNMVDYGAEMFEDLMKDYMQSAFWIKVLYDFVGIHVIYFLLDLNWAVAYSNVPQRYIQEMWGVAAGSMGKVDLLKLRRINMVPELIRAACTILGVHGAASSGGKLLHLRTLDWQPTAYVNQYPAIIIYNPSEAGSNVFANIGYIGLVGSMTAISKNGITVGEKVMYVRQASDYPVEPTYTYFGKPWMFVLRDVAQFAKNMHDIETQLLNTHRTCMIHLGFGSLPDNTFRGVDYASNVIIFYDDKNYTRYASGSHPQMNDVFFYDKHVQPSGNCCIANILTAAYGNITPETLYRDVAGYHRSGDAQVVVMDPQGQQIWVSFSQYGAAINAYTRSPIHVKLSDFW